MFSPKDPEEAVTLTFDFTRLTALPSSPVFEVEVVQGHDPNPQNILDFLPYVEGAKVRQRVAGGVADCTYNVRCKVSAPDGSIYVLAGELPVINF